MLENWNKIKENSYWVGWILTIFLLVSFTANRQKERVCSDIHIHVDKQLENYFIEKDDVTRLITDGNKKIIVGKSKEALDLKYYEELILEDRFVVDARVNLAHNGDMYVSVVQNKPIARVFVGNKSYYLDPKGYHLPLSNNYTARVVIVDASEHSQSSKQEDYFNKEGKSYVELVNFINQNSFWHKQISDIRIDKNGRVTLETLIGKQKIIFGNPDEIESKFEKLAIFFKKILPSVGWNKYKLVNLEFKEQIVCE